MTCHRVGYGYIFERISLMDAWMLAVSVIQWSLWINGHQSSFKWQQDVFKKKSLTDKICY